jgi:RimJ/RimL family protein N-acetyltransferase
MIEGRRINLRAREEEDTPAFHRWFNDPEVTRFVGNGFPALSMEQQRAFIQKLANDPGRRPYSIILKDGSLIGNCEMHDFNWTARSCVIGIVIGEKEYWGKGYGSEAVDLMLRIAFDGLNLHKVALTVAAFNERGIRAYRKVGFKEEGRLRDDRFVDGQFHDTLVMSVLEAEWRERQVR